MKIRAIVAAFFLLSASVFALPRVIIKEKSGSAQSNVPITLSLAFIEGEVNGPLAVTAGGTGVASQMDVKRHWPGGSIKHALVSFIVPSLAANQSLPVTFAAGGSTDSTPITVSSILATDFDAEASFVIGGTTYRASARELLSSGTPLYWLKGPVATEFILRGRPKTSGGAASPDILVQFCVRFFQGLTRARVSFEPENVVKTHRQDVDYSSVTLSVGNTSKTQVYTKSNVKHYYCTRWRKEYFWGQAPAGTEIHLDVPYLISAGFVQRYDTASVPGESRIASRFSSWQGSNNDILGNGLVSTAFGTTGARDEIGPQPGWTAEYIVSQDNRLKEVVCGHGGLSGSVSIHWRESDSVRTISLWQYPTFTLNNPQWANASDRPPAPTGTCTSPFQPDGAHQPCFAYIPYLFTGDYYYLEEMYYWANWNIIKAPFDSPSRDLHSQGILSDQVRGIAWTFRSFVEAAALAPDNDFEKVYFDSLARNNIGYNVDRLFGASPDNTMGWWRSRNLNTSYCGYGATVTWCTSPFETDFVTIIMDHAVDLGYDGAVPLRDFGLKFNAGRFDGTGGLPPACGTPYRMPTVVNDVTLDNWADVYTAMGSPTDCGLSYPTCCQCYSFIARAALTAASRSTQAGAPAAFTWLDGQLDAKAVFAGDITFGLMPGPARLNYTSVENGTGVPQKGAFRLSVFPNPFHPETLIRFAGARLRGRAVVRVFDMRGRCVDEIRVDAVALNRGLRWTGRGLASGLYVFRAECGRLRVEKRAVLAR